MTKYVRLATHCCLKIKRNVQFYSIPVHSSGNVVDLHCETEKYNNFDHKELRTGTTAVYNKNYLKLNTTKKKETWELKKVSSVYDC